MGLIIEIVVAVMVLVVVVVVDTITTEVIITVLEVGFQEVMMDQVNHL